MGSVTEWVDAFQIQSRHGEKLKLSNQNGLLSIFKREYPEWPADSLVITIPPMAPSQKKPEELTDDVIRNLGSIKGKEGEDKIYNYFVDAGEKSSDGLLLFPNLTGRDLMTKVPMFEIDLVVIHPTKGVFVVSVKSGTNFRTTDELESMKRHMTLIREIRDYKFDSCQNIPIYGVLCSNAKTVEAPDNWKFRNIWVLNPHDLASFEAFKISWGNILREMGNIDFNENFRVLASRLYAISSKEELTGIRDTEVGYPGNSQQYEGYHVPASVRVIIWTRRQMDVIARFLDLIMDPSGSKIQLFVYGPRHSGKTLLLVYLAKLAEVVMRVKGTSTYNNHIVVCDGTPFWMAGDQFLNDAFRRTNVRVQRGVSGHHAQHFAMAFYDNFDSSSDRELLTSKHSVICSSENNVQYYRNVYRSFEFMKLDA